MADLRKQLTAGNQHPREDFFNVVPANLGALNAEVIIDADGCSTVSLDLRGTYNVQIEVAGTVDGVNYTSIPMRPINATNLVYQAFISTQTGVFVGKCANYRKVRARVTSYTSGSASAVLLASNGALDDSLQGMVTPLLVTTTAAVSTAATLTLPSAGVGLRHYITYLRVVKFASTALTAAAAPVLITTTNIPGALVLTLPADAAAQGTQYGYQEDFSYPLATSAQNANTTIVAPLTTGVIWRITAGYYVAP